MSASPRAFINPELLVWARKSSGLSIEAAAKRLVVKPDKLAAWEAGTVPLSIAKLRQAAGVYKRPLAVFFLPEPPRDFQAMKDFRGPRLGEPDLSPDLQLEFRRAYERRDVALELTEAMHDQVPMLGLTATTSDDPEDVAAKLRARLGITLKVQADWGGEQYEALRAWKTAAENCGVLVFETERVEPTEARGFSMADDVFPVVALNGKDAPLGRVFTLGHELAHVLIRNAGVCEYLEHAEHQATELFCNRVSGALLMPRDAVLTEQDAAHRQDVDMNAARRLAKTFAVSPSAAVMRLAELNRLPVAKARAAVALLAKAYQAKEKVEKELRIPRHVLMLKRHGRAFSSLVLAAYRTDAITLSDASGFLGMKVPHLEKLEAALYAKAAG